MATQFRVTLKNIKGRNLPAKDTNGKSDPFLECNFDNFKTFRTEIVKANLNPDWKFESVFFYETRYPDKLDKKVLKIDCYDYDRFGKNDYIGTLSLDLLTACTGPVNHDILLRDGGKPAGRLQFDLEMEQISDITVTLKEIHISGYTPFDPEGNGDVSLSYYYTGSKDKKTFKSATVKPSQLNWPDVEQLYFSASLKELLNESIIFKITHNQRLKGDANIGDAQLRIKELISVTSFKDNVTKEGKVVGQIEGNIHFTNIPKFAQMLTGKHTDTGIVAGQPLLPGLPVPNGFVGASPVVAPNSQVAMTTNTTTTKPDAISSGPQRTESRNSMYPDLGQVGVSINHTSPIVATPPQQQKTQQQVVLPPGWEMRLDVSSGKNYYVDHNTKTSHWTLPAHIANAVPTSPTVTSHSTTTIPSAVVASSNLPYQTNTGASTSSSNISINIGNNSTSASQPSEYVSQAVPYATADHNTSSSSQNTSQYNTQQQDQYSSTTTPVSSENPSYAPSVPPLDASTDTNPNTSYDQTNANAPNDSNSTAPYDQNTPSSAPYDSSQSNSTAPYDSNNSIAPYDQNTSSAPYDANSSTAPYDSNNSIAPYDSNTSAPIDQNSGNSSSYNSTHQPYDTNNVSASATTTTTPSHYDPNQQPNSYNNSPYGTTTPTSPTPSPYGSTTSPTPSPYGTTTSPTQSPYSQQPQQYPNSAYPAKPGYGNQGYPSPTQSPYGTTATPTQSPYPQQQQQYPSATPTYPYPASNNYYGNNPYVSGSTPSATPTYPYQQQQAYPYGTNNAYPQYPNQQQPQQYPPQRPYGAYPPGNSYPGQYPYNNGGRHC